MPPSALSSFPLPKPSRLLPLAFGSVTLLFANACTTAQKTRALDQRAAEIIADKQIAGLGDASEFTIERPEYTLRRRLLSDHDLAFFGPASLGSAAAPADPATAGTIGSTSVPVPSSLSLPPPERPPLPSPFILSLNEALQIAAANSRAYQGQKEAVFRSALALDLAREEFRTSFAGLVSTLYRQNRTDLDNPGGIVTERQETAATLRATQALKTGGQLTLRLGIDLVKLLQPGGFTTESVFGDASISVPLLRGAGRRVAAEGLTQAERNTLYAIYDFEDYKRGFAVGIARQYLSALQNDDRVRNAEENYRSLIIASRRARRLLQAGSLPPIQVDQAIQDELRARNRWVSARAAAEGSLDNFKLQLGLPVDAVIQLQRSEFEALSATYALAGADEVPPAIEVAADDAALPADAAVILEEESPVPPGPFELPYDEALQLAFERRLDLRIADGRVADARRALAIGVNRFLPNLDLQVQGRSDAETFERLDANTGSYSAGLFLDLPLNRTRETIAYRQSLIALESAVRSVQELEDRIKLDIRSRLRALREARDSLHIQGLSVTLARRRVRGADLNLQAGRVPIRDLLEAQEALLSAQNALASAAVAYRLAELDLQRDLGVLIVTPDGLWREFTPSPSADLDPSAVPDPLEATDPSPNPDPLANPAGPTAPASLSPPPSLAEPDPLAGPASPASPTSPTAPPTPASPTAPAP